MNIFRKSFYSLVLIIMAAPLGGCESMDAAMLDVKERFASMNLDMPTVTATNKGYSHRDEKSVAYTNESIDDTITITKIQTSEKIKEEEKELILTKSGNCPSVSIIKELDSLHQFTNPSKPSPSGKISAITLTKLKTNCKYNKNNLVVEMDLDFRGSLGPRARVWATDKPSFAYPYFMAITTPKGNIIAKEVFAATVSYGKDEQTVIHEESLRQIIPLNGNFDANHEILIGFQLTEGELAYNRSLSGETPHWASNENHPSTIETSSGTEKRKIKPIAATPTHKPQKIVIKETPEKEMVIEVKTEEQAPVTEAVEKMEITTIDMETEAVEETETTLKVPSPIFEEMTEPVILDITADN